MAKTRNQTRRWGKIFLLLLCYVNDILCIHHNADTVLQQLHQSFSLKPGFGNPDMCLVVKLCKARLHHGVWAWAMSHIKYVWEKVRSCATHLVTNYNIWFKLPKKAENPFKMCHSKELDISPELEPDAVSYFLTVIGILWWMIVLGRIDIITKVLLLSSHLALPREGHLDAAVHVMTHAGQRYDLRLVYNLLCPEIDHSVFKKCDWSEFYWDAEEAIPINPPKPQGKEVNICSLLIVYSKDISLWCCNRHSKRLNI